MGDFGAIAAKRSGIRPSLKAAMWITVRAHSGLQEASTALGGWVMLLGSRNLLGRRNSIGFDREELLANGHGKGPSLETNASTL